MKGEPGKTLETNGKGSISWREDWEKEFDDTWKNVNGITVLDLPLKDFIRKTRLDAQKEILEELWIFGKRKKEISLLLLWEFANSIGIILSE